MNKQLRRIFIILVLLFGILHSPAQQINLTASHGSLSWSGAALNTTCQVQRAYSLLGNNWTNLQSIKVTNSTMTTIVSMVSTSSPAVFYRIMGIPAPAIHLTPTSGPPSTSVTAQVFDFQSGEQVKIYYAGAFVTSVIANVSGNGSAMFTVPNGTTGTNTVLAVGQSSGDQASAPFDQTPPPPSIQLLPNSGLPGTSVTATVTNFEAGEQVKIYYAGALQTSLIADVSGNGSAMFSVPNGTTGTNTVLAVGQSSGDQASAPFDQTP
jgi:hypothetical protein